MKLLVDDGNDFQCAPHLQETVMALIKGNRHGTSSKYAKPYRCKIPGTCTKEWSQRRALCPYWQDAVFGGS